jgi:hypothetical protein
VPSFSACLDKALISYDEIIQKRLAGMELSISGSSGALPSPPMDSVVKLSVALPEPSLGALPRVVKEHDADSNLEVDKNGIDYS